MIVEIHGAGFKNKGAELMLRAAVSGLCERVPGFIPAIDPMYGAYESRCKLSLYQILPPRSHVGSPGFLRRFNRQKWLNSLGWDKWFRFLTGTHPNAYGCVWLSSIRGLIDIAGFAYTDEWGAQPTKDFSLLTSYYRSKGKPVILMPQAFGPFQRNETRSAFRKVLDNATLVFPRDQQSYDYVLELAADPRKIMKAPDITLFYPEVPFELTYAPDTNYVCVVPNIRILDQGKQAWGDIYQSYLYQIIKEFLRHDLQVHVVVHDTSGDDLKLAQYLCEESSSPAVNLVQEEDPIALKRLICGSLMVVGSRYHSLIAAFSGHVPSIAIGWSHKYKMLFRDFGCEKFVLPDDTSIETILQYVRELVDTGTNTFYRNQIAQHLREMHVANQKMWLLVTDVLNSRSN